MELVKGAENAHPYTNLSYAIPSHLYRNQSTIGCLYDDVVQKLTEAGYEGMAERFYQESKGLKTIAEFVALIGQYVRLEFSEAIHLATPNTKKPSVMDPVHWDDVIKTSKGKYDEGEFVKVFVTKNVPKFLDAIGQPTLPLAHAIITDYCLIFNGENGAIQLLITIEDLGNALKWIFDVMIENDLLRIVDGKVANVVIPETPDVAQYTDIFRAITFSGFMMGGEHPTLGKSWTPSKELVEDIQRALDGALLDELFDVA